MRVKELLLMAISPNDELSWSSIWNFLNLGFSFLDLTTHDSETFYFYILSDQVCTINFIVLLPSMPSRSKHVGSQGNNVNVGAPTQPYMISSCSTSGKPFLLMEAYCHPS